MAVTQDLLDKINQYETLGQWTTEQIIQGLAQSKNYPDIAKKIQGYINNGETSDRILEGIKQSPIQGIVQIQSLGQPPPETTIRTAPPKVFEMGGEVLQGLALGAADIAGVAGPIPRAAIGGTAMAVAGSLYRGAEVALSYEEPETATQALTRGGKQFLTGAMYQMGGEVAGKVAGTVAATLPFGKPAVEKMVPSVESEVLDRIKLFEKFGLKPTPAQIYPTSKSLGILEGVLGYKPFSGDVMLRKSLNTVDTLMEVRNGLIAKGGAETNVEQIGKRIRQEAQTILTRYTDAKGTKLTSMVDDFMSRWGTMGRHEAGATWQVIMTEAKGKAEQGVKDAYSIVEAKLPTGAKTYIPHQETIDAAEQAIAKESESLLPTQRTIKTMEKIAGKQVPKEVGISVGGKEINVPMDKEMLSIMGEIKDKSVTWEGLKDTKTKLNERIAAIRKSTGGKDTTESMRLAKVTEAIDKDMENYARAEGGEGLWKTYMQARAKSQRYHDLYEKDILGIINQPPEDIVKRIIKNGEVTLIRQVQAVAGEQGLIPLRKAMFREIFDIATSGGNVNPKMIKDIIGRRLGGFESDTIKSLMTPEQINMLKGIVDKGISFKTKLGTKLGDKVDFLEKILDKDNKNVMNYIFSPNGSEAAELARKLLSKESMNEIKSYATENMLRLNAQKQFLPGTISKEFAQHDSALKVLFKDEPWRYQNIKDTVTIGNYLSRVEKLAVNASQTSQILMGSALWRQIVDDIIKWNPMGMVRYAGMPWAIAKVYSSKTLSNMMVRAIKAGPQTSEGTALFTKMIMLLANQEAERKRKEQGQGEKVSMEQ